MDPRLKPLRQQLQLRAKSNKRSKQKQVTPENSSKVIFPFALGKPRPEQKHIKVVIKQGHSGDIRGKPSLFQPYSLGEAVGERKSDEFADKI